ncbi:CHAD domain-containing protein [Amycolatopsis sp. NPDC051903]|uniref:CYTH and CHAD domain-containing protein n=1 Tax=Amycolatopsis sp. NPDC051903 TaxID=3363936 RepID=UPI0037A94F4E
MRRPVTELERERKYEIAPGTAVPRFSGNGTVRGQDAPVEQLLDATYYDTEGFALAAAGITLRRRVGGKDAGWHLKLPVAQDTREELRVPLDAEDAKVPRELRQLLRAYTLEGKLLPMAHLKTDRFEHELSDAAGHVVATVTDDHVTGEVGGETARLDSWRELEVELATDAPPELLDELESTLADAGARASAWPSKLRRLIGDRVPASPSPGKRPDAGEVVGTYLRDQLAALRRADVGVRRDVDDSVHQLRVASRKLRSALRTFSSIVDDERVASVAEELKWLGGELGPARDNEVTEALLRDWFLDAPDALVAGPVEQYLTRRFSRDAVELRARAVTALESRRYLALVRELDAVVAEVANGRGPAREVLRAPVRQAERKLRKAQRAADGKSGAELERALHDVRKKAKRARYAADVVRPVYGTKLRKWRTGVKRVQQALGEHQDWVVARPVVLRLGVDGRDEGVGFSFGVVYGSADTILRAKRDEFTTRWGKLAKGKRPRWL